MGYVTKLQPIGVDIVINNIIEEMYESLTEFGWTNYEAYHRCYKNPKSKGELYIPEAYTKDSNFQDEYNEVLLDDTRYSSSFFITGDTTTKDNGNYTVPISIIFQLNSRELYPDLMYRADEEARNDAIVAISKSIHGGEITDIVTHIPNVYSEFDTSQIDLDDMSPFHVFRVNMEVNVNYDCDYYCTYPSGDGFQYIMDSGLN